MFNKINVRGADPRDVCPVGLGGSGAQTIASAIENLGFQKTSTMNQPGNTAALDAYGSIYEYMVPEGIQIKPAVSLDGLLACTVDATITFKITNYDSFTSYVIQTLGGKATRSGEDITFVAGSAACTAKMIINGTVFNISVTGGSVSGIPNKPIIISPFPGSYNALNDQTFQASPYIEIGGSAHASSDWEISTKPDFSSVNYSNYATTTNKTSWTVAAMAGNTKYFVRTRYRAANGTAGEWSDSYWFMTSGAWRQREKIFDASTNQFSYYGAGTALSRDGNYMLVGSERAMSGNQEVGCIYVYQKVNDNWVYKRKLYSPDPEEGSRLGTSCALNEDGTVAIVCSVFRTVSGFAKAGSAMVYFRSGDTWTFKNEVSASDPAASDLFGISCAITADGTRFVVGAYSQDDTVSGSGCVYYFDLDLVTGSANELGKLHAAVPASGDSFGFSTALSSDGTKLLVGAPSLDGVGSNSGTVYYFTCSNTNWSTGVWTEQNHFYPLDPVTNDVFGRSVTMDSTGINALVGCSSSDAGFTSAGAVYSFSRSGSLWGQQGKILCSDINMSAGDEFGRNVSMTGDGNTAVVGALSAFGSKADQGAVYMFVKYTGVVPDQEKVKLLSPNTSDFDNRFGSAVDINDAYSVAVVGAPYEGREDAGFSADGAAYIYTRSGEVWTMAQKLLPDAGFSWDRFGNSVSISGDGNVIAIGSYTDDIGATNSGSVYLYVKSGATWNFFAKVGSPNPEASGGFGNNISFSGTASDGYLIVGAPYEDVNGVYAQGRAYIFRKTATELTLSATIEDTTLPQQAALGANVRVTVAGANVYAAVGAVGWRSTYEPNTHLGSVVLYQLVGGVWTKVADFKAKTVNTSSFGASIDIDINGTMILIGSYGYVFMYTKVGSVWDTVEKQVIRPTEANAGNWFGADLRIDNTGNALIVGAPSEDINGVNSGAAYLFRKENSVWVRKSKLTARVPAAGDLFGRKVAVAGNMQMAIVGSSGANSTEYDGGAAYIFGT